MHVYAKFDQNIHFVQELSYCDYNVYSRIVQTHIVSIVQTQGSCNIVQIQGSCNFNLMSKPKVVQYSADPGVYCRPKGRARLKCRPMGRA